MLIAVGSLHRFFVFFAMLGHLRRLLADNPSPITWQFLVLEGYEQHFWRSILYLQQGPPVPHAVIAFAVEVFGYPAGTAWFLIALQGAVSIATAWLVFHFLWRVTARPDVSWVIAVVFLLSTDLLVMEYSAFGLTFHENLAMLLVLAFATTFERWYGTKQPVWVLSAGLLVGVLALTRATFSWFALVPLGFLLAGVRLRDERTRLALGLFCAGLLPHAAWCAKNWVVYRTATPVTTSWEGIHLAMGLAKRGHERAFVESILAEPERYEDWVVRMLSEKGFVHWHPPLFVDYVPPEIREQDMRIQGALGGTNRFENTVGQRVLSEQYTRAFRRFAREDPRRLARGVAQSYAVFWQPIRNYSEMFLAPLYVEPRVRRSFDLTGTLRTYVLDPLGEEQLAMQGTVAEKRGTPVRFLTLPLLPDLMHSFNMLMIHGLAPLVLLVGYAASLFRRKLLVPPAYLMLVFTYAYTALVTSVVEHGENMRLRLDVEPVIWILSVWSAALVVRSMRFFARRFSSAAER